MFYYTLANLPPHLRSTQRSIQLIACGTSRDIKEYGFGNILQPFIDDINRLSEVRSVKEQSHYAGGHFVY